MKGFCFALLSIVGINFAYSQADTLDFTTRREVADTVFGLLTPSAYGYVLLDRSASECAATMNMVKGIYPRVHDFASWIQLYSDVSVSYTDPEMMFDDEELLLQIDSITGTYRDTVDQLVQPCGLLLHEVSVIDSVYVDSLNPSFTSVNSRLQLKSQIQETDIYRKVWVKSAALIEFAGDHGYESGTIVYQPEFISTGQDIEINSLRLNVGNGFVDFSSSNSRINYEATRDFTIARVAVDYSFRGSNRRDTLSFYLTTETYKYKNDNTKSADRWDRDDLFFNGNSMDLLYAVKYGCGNGTKIRRPVIIAPPYRPNGQNFSLKKYYDQFDYKSVISSLSDMGYDVIFLKEDPGNKSLEIGGSVLAEFLKKINSEKKENYPDEDWENVVIGYSAGGQQWRFALKLMEKQHMESGYPHHHTRLYIPFDSPHWGASVPLFAQAVFHEQRNYNPLAGAVYERLTDGASKDMLMYHILQNDFDSSNDDFTYEPAQTSERSVFVNTLNNSFNHQFTPLNDLRRSFPSFTRNVAVSTGSNSKDYTTEYGLDGGELLFHQNSFLPMIGGVARKNRYIYSSDYTAYSTAYYVKDVRMYLLIVPAIRQRRYITRYLPEFDLAQGGYKDEFYDGHVSIFNNDNDGYPGVPTGATTILRWSNWGFGQKHYNKHMSFLPMVSALGINPSLWANNQLYYNLKDEGLMYQKFDYTPVIDYSDLYGYPHLAHPASHFNITPFEAVYCDPQTYEHIKLMETLADNDGMDETYVVHTRNFILDEVEADVVGLQNKIIGDNHVQWDPYFRYSAWYKAYTEIIIGNKVTPKTDPGDYIIKPSGDITVYAGQSISIKPGFHTQNGSQFHAYIQDDGCSRPRESGNLGQKGNKSEIQDDLQTELALAKETIYIRDEDSKLKAFPNPGNGKCTITLPACANGNYTLYDLNGRLLKEGILRSGQEQLDLQLPKGICYFRWICEERSEILKIVVL